MAVLHRSNNRIIPTNTRAADVARATIDGLLPHQALRYHNAFKVEGYDGVLYNKLRGGTICNCMSRQTAAAEAGGFLDADGNASPGAINEMLTGGAGFGILPFGVRPRSPLVIDDGATPLQLSRGEGLSLKTRQAQSSVSPGSTGDDDFDWEDEIPRTNVPYPSAATGFQSSGMIPPNIGRIVTPDAGNLEGDGLSGEFAMEELITNADSNGIDSCFMGLNDVACPICLGSGFVGGYSVYNGYRKVLVAKDASSPIQVFMEEQYAPAVVSNDSGGLTFDNVVLPPSISLDSFRLMMATKVVPVLGISIDGSAYLPQDNAVLNYCDGKPHTINFNVNPGTQFTHVEIQINQSAESTLFEFPKVTQGSIETLIDRMEPFSIIVSPRIANVSTGDVIVDSTWGKAFVITSCNLWNDRRRQTIGWECSVRVVQPGELQALLPRRRLEPMQPNSARGSLLVQQTTHFPVTNVNPG